MIRETPREMRVTVRNIGLTVPIVDDAKTTLALAEALDARLAEIEEQTGRVDTQLFALLTAFQFAGDLHRLRRERDEEQRELVKLLDQLAERLNGIADATGA